MVSKAHEFTPDLKATRRKGVDDGSRVSHKRKSDAGRNSLALARQGYDLMDRSVMLLKELMALIDEAKEIQEQIDSTFTKAYACLQRANIEHGISKVQLARIYRADRGIPFVSRREAS